MGKTANDKTKKENAARAQRAAKRSTKRSEDAAKKKRIQDLRKKQDEMFAQLVQDYAEKHGLDPNEEPECAWPE